MNPYSHGSCSSDDGLAMGRLWFNSLWLLDLFNFSWISHSSRGSDTELLQEGAVVSEI